MIIPSFKIDYPIGKNTMEQLKIGAEIKASFDNFSSEYERIHQKTFNLESYFEILYLKLSKIDVSAGRKIYIFDGTANIFVGTSEKKYKFKLCVSSPTFEFCLYDEQNQGPFEFLKDADGYQYSPDYFFSIFLGIEKKYNSGIPFS